jgi:hypothetical protein
MEEVLISIAKDTPILALLGVVLIVIFRMQAEREKKECEERKERNTQFVASIDKATEANEKLATSSFALLEEVKQNGNELKNLIRIVDESHISQLQAHQYQQQEHAQMIKVLEKMNGK